MVRFRVEMEGADRAKALLRDLPREAQAGARDAAGRIGDMLIDRVEAAARSQGGLAAKIADAGGVPRDRFPNVRFPARQSATFTSSGRTVKVRDVIYGAEFGGRGRPATMQFKQHSGQTGYWFFPTVRRSADEIGALWLTALDDWAARWDQPGA